MVPLKMHQIKKTMTKLGSARLLLSRESHLITELDNAVPMLALDATLMLAIRCSHYSSPCLNAK